MKVTARIRDFTSEECKYIITRNLSRILEIKILDINMENKTISFHYYNKFTFEKTKRELHRIGHPILRFTIFEPKNEKVVSGLGDY